MEQFPIGTVVGWMKSLPGTPDLCGGWAEMNGQVLDYPGSPYHGQTLPPPNIDGRFLKGGLISGVLEDDMMQGHRHPTYIDTGTSTAGNQGIGGHGSPGDVLFVGDGVRDPITDGVHGTPRTGPRTQPICMSVVWILKVAEGEALGIDAATLQSKQAAEFALADHNHGGTFTADADTLDGKHASAFAPAEAADTLHYVTSFLNSWYLEAGGFVAYIKKAGVVLVTGEGLKNDDQYKVDQPAFILPDGYRCTNFPLAPMGTVHLRDGSAFGEYRYCTAHYNGMVIVHGYPGWPASFGLSHPAT